MIEIDGSEYSGSGTILRHSVALATLLRKPLHVTKIRARRSKPGLRRQHLQAIMACCELSGGKVEGAEVNSTEILYEPGAAIRAGDFQWDIGSAGSTTMLAFTLIPPAIFSEAPHHFQITGGLFQDFAPSAFHMQRVLLPTLQQMGVQAELQVLRPGYVPEGKGLLAVGTLPLVGPLRALKILEPGPVKRIQGISLSSHLAEQKVSERMAQRSQNILTEKGYRAEIRVLQDTSALQKGAVLTLWAETQKGCLLGADRAGRVGRSSEAIGEHVARSLLEDIQAGATVDRYLADQLILFASLARGVTEYLIPMPTEHVETNLWLVEKIVGAKTSLKETHLRVEGIGFDPAGASRPSPV